MMGFSAGGHLASTAGTHFDGGKADATIPSTRIGSRPDFLILGYPVISFDPAIRHAGSVRESARREPGPEAPRDLSNDLRVTAQTPPTFIFHTNADTGVPAENSVRFYLALVKAKVPAEMHLFENGRTALARARRSRAQRMADVVANWLRARGLLTKP